MHAVRRLRRFQRSQLFALFSAYYYTVLSFVKNFADSVTVHAHEYVYRSIYTELNFHLISKFGNNWLERNIT